MWIGYHDEMADAASDDPVVGWLVVVMSLAVIGVHGMLSGTASADFGGRKNAGTAVGIIDTHQGVLHLRPSPEQEAVAEAASLLPPDARGQRGRLAAIAIPGLRRRDG